MPVNYARRLTLLLIASTVLLLFVSVLTIVNTPPLTITNTTIYTTCLVISFRSWYIVHRTLTKKKEPSP